MKKKPREDSVAHERIRDALFYWKGELLSTEQLDETLIERIVHDGYRALGRRKVPARIVHVGSPLKAVLMHAWLKELRELPRPRDARFSVGSSVGELAGADDHFERVESIARSLGTEMTADLMLLVRKAAGMSPGAMRWRDHADYGSIEQSIASVYQPIQAGIMQSVKSSAVSRCARASAMLYRNHNQRLSALSELNTVRDSPTVSALRALGRIASTSFLWGNLAIVHARPTSIVTDELGRLHCASGPAMVYPDGWSIAAWHGTVVPLEWITAPKSVDPTLALTLRNAEQARALVEIIGWLPLIERLDPTVIDEDPNPEIGTLLAVPLPNDPEARFLKFRCGTGRTFVRPVSPDVSTAQEAQNWMWQLDDYAPEVRT